METDPLGPSPFLILSTNSIPSMTLPKTVYCLSKCGAASKQIKNWLFALSGSADLAADKTPLVWAISVNSAFTFGPKNDAESNAFAEFFNVTGDISEFTQSWTRVKINDYN